jgi:DNA-binding transcriptional LysR family regulator
VPKASKDLLLNATRHSREKTAASTTELPYSLDQLQVFLTVVDMGGFASAARHLNRAQSAITYAIRTLEEHTGLILFDRGHYRPQLTEAGRTLLPRARRIVAELVEFHQQAHEFALGVEAELNIVVNEFADLSLVVTALKQMRAQYPSVRVRMTQQAFGEDIDMIRRGIAQLGFIPEIAPLGNEFVSNWVAQQRLVAVAAPQHPLANQAMPMDVESLQRHLQIVWTRSTETMVAPKSAVLPMNKQQDLGIHSLDTWYVTELTTKRQCILAGLGWGSLPLHLIRDDLACGALVELKLTSWEGRDRMPGFDLCVCRLKKLKLGPAATFLIAAMAGQVDTTDQAGRST